MKAEFLSLSLFPLFMFFLLSDVNTISLDTHLLSAHFNNNSLNEDDDDDKEKLTTTKEIGVSTRKINRFVFDGHSV